MAARVAAARRKRVNCSSKMTCHLAAYVSLNSWRAAGMAKSLLRAPLYHRVLTTRACLAPRISRSAAHNLMYAALPYAGGAAIAHRLQRAHLATSRRALSLAAYRAYISN